jgi:hypothetical protein
MSEPLRLALVAEGPTDRVVLEAAIARLLNARPFVLNQLQPEQSLAFGPHGGGWGGVYRWCQQATIRSGGSLRGDPLFEFHDVLVLHLDADVANERYQSANIRENPGDLPCAEPCPPAQATTDRLREVLLRWVGEPTMPDRAVLCVPSKSTDAWVVAALFPTDPAVLDGSHECRSHGQQPLRIRIEKSVSVYESHKETLREAWLTVMEICTEARRFGDDFRMAVQRVDATSSATDSQ